MKNVFIIILSIFLLGCEGEGTNPAQKNLKVYYNAQITENYPFVIRGEKTVFHYFYQKEDEEYIADDEFSEDFFIEISDTNEFSMSTADLALYDLPVLYKQSCFCAPLDQVALSDFNLNGKRLSNGDWILTGQVNLQFSFEYSEETWDKNLNIKGNYLKSSIPVNR